MAVRAHNCVQKRRLGVRPRPMSYNVVAESWQILPQIVAINIVAISWPAKRVKAMVEVWQRRGQKCGRNMAEACQKRGRKGSMPWSMHEDVTIAKMAVEAGWPGAASKPLIGTGVPRSGVPPPLESMHLGVHVRTPTADISDIRHRHRKLLQIE